MFNNVQKQSSSSTPQPTTSVIPNIIPNNQITDRNTIYQINNSVSQLQQLAAQRNQQHLHQQLQNHPSQQHARIRMPQVHQAQAQAQFQAQAQAQMQLQAQMVAQAQQRDQVMKVVQQRELQRVQMAQNSQIKRRRTDAQYSNLYHNQQSSPVARNHYPITTQQHVNNTISPQVISVSQNVLQAQNEATINHHRNLAAQQRLTQTASHQNHLISDQTKQTGLIHNRNSTLQNQLITNNNNNNQKQNKNQIPIATANLLPQHRRIDTATSPIVNACILSFKAKFEPEDKTKDRKSRFRLTWKIRDNELSELRSRAERYKFKIIHKPKKGKEEKLDLEVTTALKKKYSESKDEFSVSLSGAQLPAGENCSFTLNIHSITNSGQDLPGRPLASKTVEVS